MNDARRQHTRTLLGGLSAFALAFYAGCASSDVNTNRQGSDSPPAVPDAAETDVGAGVDASLEASAADGRVPWCAAYKIINCVCQQCHQNPPLHSAPVPLMTYNDTQAPSYAGSTSPVWQTMQAYVANRYMPYTGDKTVMPVVLPLSGDDYDTLLNWFAQGATDLGGQDCPMECDWSKGPPPGR